MNDEDRFKLNKMLRNAGDFYEAAKRCEFTKSKIKFDNLPLLIPEFVNRSFSCELYLKAIALLKNIGIGKIHKLHEIYLKLENDAQVQIYNLWLTIDGNDIVDCDYARKMFRNNLESISNYFARFRYEHEWGGSTIGNDSHLTLEQRQKIFNTNNIGNPPIYNGFLLQFANVLRLFLASDGSTKW